MKRAAALAVLKAHEAELKQLGVVSASLFGSTARDTATESSDVDVAVRLDGSIRGFRAVGQLERIREWLSELLREPVDVIPEPVNPGPLTSSIDRDRCLVF